MSPEQRAEFEDLFEAAHSTIDELGDFGANEAVGEIEDAVSDLLNDLARLWKQVTP